MPWEERATNVYKSITEVAAETADRAKPGVPDPPRGRFLPLTPTRTPTERWISSLRWAPGHFPGYEFPLAL